MSHWVAAGSRYFYFFRYATKTTKRRTEIGGTETPTVALLGAWAWGIGSLGIPTIFISVP